MAPRDRREFDSEWPKGYPFVATRAFNNTNNIPNVISLRLGDEGKVTSKPLDNGNICVQFPKHLDGSPGREGWVPSDHIRIGYYAQIGEPILIDIKEPEAATLSDNLYVDDKASEGVFGQTVSGLLSGYYDIREELPTEPEYLSETLDTHQKIRELTQKIVQGSGRASPELRRCLDSGNFTVHDIRKQCPTADKDSHPGIYIIVYSDFIGQPDRLHEIYIGSTVRSIGERYSEHVDARKNPDTKSIHYLAARAARKHEVFPLCYLNGLAEDSPEIKLAEQVFLNLFQAYCKRVLRFHGDGFVGENEEPDAAKDETALSRVAKYYIHKEEAVLLKKMSEEVFERTHWSGALDKKGGVPFGATVGLNWKSPLSEIRRLRMIWTKTSIPGRIANFRRIGFKAHVITSGGGAKDMVVFEKGHSPGNRPWRVLLRPDEPWPPANTEVHVVFEVRLDNQTHVASFSRAVGVGPFSDWANANKVAIRIEWQDAGGRWYYRYAQLRDDQDKLPYAPAGGMQNYNIGTGLRSYLLQERRQLSPDLGSWMWDFGVARIKEVYLDHLDQMIRVRDVRARSNVPGPTKKNMHEMGRELVILGAGRYASPSDTQYPLFVDGQTVSSKQRRSCDHCYANVILGQKAGRKTQCDKVQGQNICARCARLGRPCTFTHNNVLENSPALLRALTNPVEYPNSVHRVTNDKMQEYRT